MEGNERGSSSKKLRVKSVSISKCDRPVIQYCRKKKKDEGTRPVQASESLKTYSRRKYRGKLAARREEREKR